MACSLIKQHISHQHILEENGGGKKYVRFISSKAAGRACGLPSGHHDPLSALDAPAWLYRRS